MRIAAKLIGALVLLAALPLQAELRGTLEQPRAGAILRGGSSATVSWSPEALPAFAEEWEAFLSADGGHYYGYRITPHLDLEHNRFTFQVPNVETDRARLLIRAGDERQEIEIELPATFSIRQDRVKALTEPPLAVAESERGEAARPGEPGVIEWIDGDRSGRELTPRTAHRRGDHLESSPRAEAASELAEAAPPSLVAPHAFVSLETIAPIRALRRRAPCWRGARDVLLAQARLNI